ncbi:hypothetical protein HRG_004691 [Hirsutella rhossiliensis]|uniref:Uncharacterized protein n=1 Tax=Hirsutella rhossiliensis TaxID=111463 RepID=A0A9P8SII9_9HYPO|nr:uncharacterized protein HRG_04691 [Hirsutella rhossiliensis]KAH0964263.1 hypothetical protein HRG_04691 [Hirsutella rhossiliensis]
MAAPSGYSPNARVFNDEMPDAPHAVHTDGLLGRRPDAAGQWRGRTREGSFERGCEACDAETGRPRHSYTVLERRNGLVSRAVSLVNAVM